MAGSNTQSMENFTAQGMERHQMMMNTEVMKHLRIMNRASVREIMLQHEKTFKEQVHDLHKLYEVQRLLMDKAKSRGRDAYVGVPPPSPGRGTVVSEEINQGQRTNFWEQATPDRIGMVMGGTSTLTTGSPPKAIPERIIRMEEMPKSTSSPVRKRKIDLEQLPEDDSDDEMENSANTPNVTTSSLSGNSRELPKVYSSFDALVKGGPGPHGESGIQPLPPVKHSQVGSFLSGESSSYCGQIDGSRGEYHCKAAPSLPTNVVKPAQSFTNFGERNVTLQNAGVGSIKNNTMFLPQPDLIDRASQETGRQASWFFQAPEANIGNQSARFLDHQQQRQSPHLPLPEHSTSRSHHPPPNLEQRHITNNSPSIESVGSIIGKASLERLSPGKLTGAHPKDASAASVERLGDTSKWFTKELFAQANIAPMARFDAGFSTEGGHGMPGVVTPAVTLASSKGSSQDRDISSWSSQNPILQLPQYQQSPVFQQQVLPPSSQPVWVQSSQNAQNNIYPQQQMVFGLHTPDPSQIGYRGEPLQRNQGDIAGSWNMIGLGHYYSSVASPPQKPPFKKPPKLVLKNDGVGMELKLVSPEKEMTEKDRALQKKPLNASKRDSLQSSSKPCENISGVHKESGEEDLKLGKRTTPEAQIPSATGEAKTVGAPLLLATASSSSALTLSQGAFNSVMLPSVAQRNLGALACTSGSETGSGFDVSVSPIESILQQGVSQPETVRPSSEPEKLAELRTSSLKSSWVASEKEPFPLGNAGTRDVQGQREGGVPKGEIDVNLGLGALQERKEPLDKMLISEGNVIDVVASSQSETFNLTPQCAQTKCNAEGGIAADLVQQRASKLEEAKGSLSQRGANAEGHHNDFSESKISSIADSMRPSSQPALQAVSSASTDTPSTSRQEKKRPSKLSTNNDLSQRVPGKITTAYKSNESGSSVSDRDCASAPSLNTTMSESKSEAIVGVLNEDLQHDSDSDNLAASILLSFAPKLDLMNDEKQSKESASEISSSSMCKVRPPSQGSKKFRSPEARMGLHSDTSNAGGSQGRRMQNNPGSSRRMDRTDHRRDHQDQSKVTLKDRYRREDMNSTDRPADEGDVVTKNLTIKLPRVATSTLNGEAIPISRSKQLSKLNGVTLSGNPVESIKNSHKGNEAVHTPTGRRSSRGPSMGARAPPENRSRLHPQTQHRVECSPPPSAEKDSGIREEGGRNINKLEGNMKSKAWGELNRTRSHPRKQFPEMSHRKSQK